MFGEVTQKEMEWSRKTPLFFFRLQNLISMKKYTIWTYREHRIQSETVIEHGRATILTDRYRRYPKFYEGSVTTSLTGVAALDYNLLCREAQRLYFEDPLDLLLSDNPQELEETDRYSGLVVLMKPRGEMTIEKLLDPTTVVGSPYSYKRSDLVKISSLNEQTRLDLARRLVKELQGFPSNSL